MKITPYIQVVALSVAVILSSPPVFASEQGISIPTILAKMQRHTEKMIDGLQSKDVTASHSQYQRIKHDVNQLHQQVEGKQFDERRSRELLMTYSWMRVIEIELTNKAWIEAAVSANQLNAMLIQAAHFPTLMQRDIAWMAYLSREVELLTVEDPVANSDLLNIRLITLENTWNRVRKELIKDFKKKPLVEQGDMLLKSLKLQSKQPAQMITLAKKLIVFVARIKK